MKVRRVIYEWLRGRFIRDDGTLRENTILICVVLSMILIFAASARAETHFQAGPSVVGGEFTGGFTLTLQERWRDKYALSLGYVSSHMVDETCFKGKHQFRCDFHVQEQVIFGAERLFRGDFEWRYLTWLNRATWGIGPYWFQRKTIVGSGHLNVRLSLEIDLTDRLSLVVSHFSNGGSGDRILVPELQPETDRSINPYRLGGEPQNQPTVRLTGPYNRGQDGVLLSYRLN